RHAANPVADPDRHSGGGTQLLVRPDVGAALWPVHLEGVGGTPREPDRDVAVINSHAVLGQVHPTTEVVGLRSEAPVAFGLDPVEHRPVLVAEEADLYAGGAEGHLLAPEADITPLLSELPL